MKNRQIKNYGLHIHADDPNAYVLGTLGGSLPRVILREDGQWDDYLPKYEPQFNDIFDSFGCTVWGTLNTLEILMKRATGVEVNYSERFIYILAGIKPPGGDPHEVAEVVKDRGVIPEDLLPMTSRLDYTEFLKPNPMSRDLLKKGLEFPYELKHEYLWRIAPTKIASRKEKMQEALKYSPLGISVTAWIEEDGVYIDDGEPNTHWCVCYGWNERGWKVFDSYDQSTKIVSFRHKIEVAKRYHLEPSTHLQQVGIIWQMYEAIAAFIKGLFEARKPVEAPISTDEPKPQPEELVELPRPSIKAFAEAIKTFEGWFPPGDQYPSGSASYRRNNPGNIKGASGQFLVFNTYDEGFNYLCDYIARVGKGLHGAYSKDCTILEFFNTYAPSDDDNHPEIYAAFVANKLGVETNFLVRNLV